MWWWCVREWGVPLTLLTGNMFSWQRISILVVLLTQAGSETTSRRWFGSCTIMGCFTSCKRCKHRDWVCTASWHVFIGHLDLVRVHHVSHCMSESDSAHVLQMPSFCAVLCFSCLICSIKSPCRLARCLLRLQAPGMRLWRLRRPRRRLCRLLWHVCL